MPLLQKRFSLFIYLLLFFSTTKADNPSSQNRFEFLTSHENATFVDNGLTVAKGLGQVYLSTLINTGIWWAVCKAPGFISEMAGIHPFTATEKQELVSIKPDFCLHLAPLIATTETALAGQVSPWPVAPSWWRSVFLMGAGLAAYSAIANHQIKSTPQNIAAAVLAYLAAEEISRTAGSAASTEILKKTEKTHIDDNAYDEIQYSTLAGLSGLISGSLIYGMLLHTSLEPARVRFISVISAIAASTLLQTISIHNAGFNIRDSLSLIATTGVGAIVGVDTEASIGAIAGAITGALAGPLTGTQVAAVSSAKGAGATAKGIAGVSVVALTGIITAAFSMSVINDINKLVNPDLKIAGAAVIAAGYALLNSLAGFAVYGHPLERSLSETTQTLWKKFLAPSDYLATLFPQLFSEVNTNSKQ